MNSLKALTLALSPRTGRGDDIRSPLPSGGEAGPPLWSCLHYWAGAAGRVRGWFRAPRPGSEALPSARRWFEHEHDNGGEMFTAVVSDPHPALTAGLPMIHGDLRSVIVRGRRPSHSGRIPEIPRKPFGHELRAEWLGMTFIGHRLRR